MKVFLIVFQLFFSSAIEAQLILKDFKFDSWFGYKLNDKSEHVYCLLGGGFFTTPNAPNTDSLITNWSKHHAKATVVPIFESGPIDVGSPNSRIIYCWVIDKNDTLNIDLVRLGCVPGTTMRRPKTLAEMDVKMKEASKGKDYYERLYVKNEDYKDFIDRVSKAEKLAKSRKLGIWK